MNKLKAAFDTIAAALGMVSGFLFGEVNGMLIALVCFMSADYISGVIAAAVRKTLSSKTGFKGLCKKFLILLFVSVSHLIDIYILNTEALTMTAVMLFYIANEGISLVENAAEIGIPVPQKFVNILKQLKKESEEK